MFEQQKVDLNLNDFANVVKIIDLVSRRGAFGGDELADVGILRNRFAMFVNQNTPKEQPAPQATEVEKEEE